MFRMLRTMLGLVPPLLFLVAAPALAQAPVSSFSDLRLIPGAHVTVLDRAGTKTSGQVTTLSGDTLSLLVDGKTRQIKEGNTVRIERRGDSLKNGMLWGLTAGGAMGVVAVTTCDPNCNGGAGPVGAIAMLAAEGMGLGALLDWLHQGHTKIYESHGGHERHIIVTPLLTRRGGVLLVRVLHF